MTFYSIIFAIAMVISILILTVLGILIMFGEYTQNWPPDLAQCPDYWTVTGSDGKYTCNPNPSLGNVGSGGCAAFNPVDKFGQVQATGVGAFAPGSPRCQRFDYANQCGFYWDGISDNALAQQNCSGGGPSNGGGGAGVGKCGSGCSPSPSPSGQENLQNQF